MPAERETHPAYDLAGPGRGTVTDARPAEEPFAPRTYQSAWQWNEDGTAKLMTAEEWLEEEAYVDATITEGDDEPDDAPSRSGTMRAIVAEIRALRRERTQWADECTRRAGAPAPTTVAAALGGCTCYWRPPTVPVYRAATEHLPDCPGRDSGYPVGVWPTGEAAALVAPAGREGA
jgi:hypothetical protein